MGAGGDRSGSSGEVLFEFTQLGQQLRVAAVDVATGTEVIIIAPPAATRGQMQTLALAKLRKRLQGVPPVAEPRRF